MVLIYNLMAGQVYLLTKKGHKVRVVTESEYQQMLTKGIDKNNRPGGRWDVNDVYRVIDKSQYQKRVGRQKAAAAKETFQAQKYSKTGGVNTNFTPLPQPQGNQSGLESAPQRTATSNIVNKDQLTGQAKNIRDIETGRLRSSSGFAIVGGEIATGKAAGILASVKNEELRAKAQKEHERLQRLRSAPQSPFKVKPVLYPQKTDFFGNPIDKPMDAMRTSFVPVVFSTKQTSMDVGTVNLLDTPESRRLEDMAIAQGKRQRAMEERAGRTFDAANQLSQQVITPWRTKTGIKEYEDRNWLGKTSTIVTAGVMTAPMAIGEGIPMVGEKAYLTYKAVRLSPVTRILAKQEYKQTLTTPQFTNTFKPWKPEGAATYLFASAGAFGVAYGSVRAPVKVPVDTFARGKTSGLVGKTAKSSMVLEKQGRTISRSNPVPNETVVEGILKGIERDKSATNKFKISSMENLLKRDTHTLIQTDITTSKPAVQSFFGESKGTTTSIIKVGKKTYIQTTKGGKTSVYTETPKGASNVINTKTALFNKKGEVFTSIKLYPKTVLRPQASDTTILFKQTEHMGTTDLGLQKPSPKSSKGLQQRVDLFSTKQITDTRTSLFKKVRIESELDVKVTQDAKVIGRAKYETTRAEATDLITGKRIKSLDKPMNTKANKVDLQIGDIQLPKHSRELLGSSYKDVVYEKGGKLVEGKIEYRKIGTTKDSIFIKDIIVKTEPTNTYMKITRQFRTPKEIGVEIYGRGKVVVDNSINSLFNKMERGKSSFKKMFKDKRASQSLLSESELISQESRPRLNIGELKMGKRPSSKSRSITLIELMPQKAVIPVLVGITPTITKTKTSPLTITQSSSITRVVPMGKTRTSSMLRQQPISINRIAQISKISQINRITPISRIAQISRTDVISQSKINTVTQPSVSIGGGFGTTPITPFGGFMPGALPPPLPPIRFNEGTGNRGGGSVFNPKYMPSVEALLFNVKGSRPTKQSVAAGINIRPILSR